MFFENYFTFLLLVNLICNDKISTADSTACENWAPYKDEWCYKILDDTFRTFSEAESSCAKLEGSPSLPTIKTKEEQEFLANYLYKTSKKVENFWIGAKFSNSSNKFQWVDNTDMSFINWDARGPRNKVDYCIEMEGDEGIAGKWIDEPCETKKNLVVCQKMQTWSLARLQKTLLDARKELRDSQENAINHIKSLEQNPVPIGFVYVQLPGQPDPKSIWPALEWSQVTSNYAGQFFRAEGGNSAAFGNIQTEDSPRMTKAENIWFENANSIMGTVDLLLGQWTAWLRTGIGGADHHHAVRFLLSNTEVRPRNQAVCIWKRIK